LEVVSHVENAVPDGLFAVTPAGRKPSSVTTIERRLSAITWNYAQRGTPLDRKDRHIATVLAGIRNTHAAPPRQ
jgi:hypothetical protein